LATALVTASIAVAVAAECVLTTDDGDVTPLDSGHPHQHQQHILILTDSYPYLEYSSAHILHWQHH
jgi:hypothetical protein